MSGDLETVPLRAMTARNCVMRNGKFYTRPGLRRILTPDSGRMLCGGFSVLSPYTAEVWHYVFDVATAAPRDLRLRIYSDDFEIFQALAIGVDVVPRIITRAVVQDQLLICSPDFPTLWGRIGTGVIPAMKVASDNIGTTAIPVPRGIVTTFCNRAAIAGGASLFFSDPVTSTGGDLRTFVAENQNQRPAPIFGIHEDANGNLAVLTSRGAYGLDAGAAAVQIVGSNGTDWRLLSHHQCYSYASSAVVQGSVFALTQSGYQPLGGQGEGLDDPAMTRRYGERIVLEEWRRARMYSGDEGPYVVSTEHAATCRVQLGEGFKSWWTHDDDLLLRGTLSDVDGEELLLCESGVYAMVGNFDGDAALADVATPAGESGSTQPLSSLAAPVPASATRSPTVRHIFVPSGFAAAAASTALKVRGSVNGTERTATLAPVSVAPVIGTTTWSSTAAQWIPARNQPLRLSFDARTDDLGIEVAFQFGSVPLGAALQIEYSDSAKRRPNND